MKPIVKLLLALSLAHVACAWSEEKPVEEDFCDKEWDGKVEYKQEGAKDEAQSEEPTAEPAEKKSEDTEQPKEDGSTGEGKEPGEGPTGEGEKKQPGEKTSKEDERGNPRDTYDKAAGLVRDAASVDDIQDAYLKGSLNNRLQEHIRNPIIGAAGKLPNFKKIESCFATMKQDLKKEIDASKKEFEDCKKKSDSSYECMGKAEPGFAAHVKTIGEKIVQCMNKSK